MSKYDFRYMYLVSATLLRPNSAISNLKTSKEEKKMGEIRKDRFILCGDEDCYLEITPASNNVIFHFGGETQTIQIPDTYDLQWSVDDEKKSCNLKTVKKKPKLLNMKFTVRALPIFRRNYLHSYNSHYGMLADIPSAVGHPEEYEGAPLRLIIKDGVVISFASDDELLAYDVGIWIPTRLDYTVDDIPSIESKIREAYNTRKIFPNATNGIEIIREEV